VTLNAIPLTAGAMPTKIADLGANDQPDIAGGAVAIWTAITADNVGGPNVWTRATGLKTGVATASAVGLFTATADGSRIAFSQSATVTGGNITATQFGVRDTAAAANAATLSGGTGNASLVVNLASADCSPDIGFVGKVLFAAFCVGTSTTTTDAKLITVPDGASVTPKRIDAASASAALGLQPFWLTDSAASKAFVIANTNKQAKIVNVAGATSANVDTTVEDGFLTKDGLTLVYRTTAGALKKSATATPAPVTLVATDVKGMIRVSGDDKNVLFRKLDPVSNLIDLNTIDFTAATPAPVALVATAAAAPLGYNGASTHAIFFGDVGQTSAKLKSIPIAGGTVKDLVDGINARLVSTGTGAVYLSNPTQMGQAPNDFTVTDISQIDTVAGGTGKLISAGVPEGEFAFKGTRVVYTRIAQTGSGLYAATLP